MERLNDPNLLRSRAFTNNSWVAAMTDASFKVLNPFDDKVITAVPDMNKEDAVQMIGNAHLALADWKVKTASERSEYLKKWNALILENKEDLATLITLESGKPIRESLAEVDYGASFIEWFAEEARRIYGDVIPGHRKDKRIVVLKQAVGVIAAITPWNFPIAMITRKIGAALAAGCTVIVKPAEETPLSALAIAELARRAGFPSGAINIITSDHPDEIGEVLCRDNRVKKISFTGSTEVGKRLMKLCADNVKRLSLELGGNAPFIVFEDAILEEAVEGAISCKYRNAGQTCICANRFFIHDAIYDSFVELLTTRLKKERIGNGLDPDCTIGPLINEKAMKKVQNLQREAIRSGASIACGGKGNAMGKNFYSPTILTDVKPDMLIAKTEIFGPISTIIRFDSEQELIEMANDTPYGLAAYFYSNDLSKVWRVAEALDYGMIGINSGMISTPVAPFGGMKQSGLGREGSKYGIDEYLDIKYLCFSIKSKP